MAQSESCLILKHVQEKERQEKAEIVAGKMQVGLWYIFATKLSGRPEVFTGTRAAFLYLGTSKREVVGSDQCKV